MKLAITLPLKMDKLFGFELAMLKVLIVPLVVVILVILSVVGVYIPKIGESLGRVTLANEIKKSTTDLLAKRNYLLSIDEEELNNSAELLNMALPRSKDVYFLLSVVSDIAGKHGYSVDSFSVNPGIVKGDEKSKASGLNQISLKMTLLGPKERFLELIGGVERTLPVLSISNLDTTEKGGVEEVELNVNTYFASDDIDIKLSSLSLADLTMTADEVQLLETLKSYEKIGGETYGGVMGGDALEFVNYNRSNPFSQ